MSSPSTTGKSNEVEAPAQATIIIDKIAVETLHIPIVGMSPLIMHKFSEKMKLQMLAAQQGKKSPKEKRDPEAEYENAFHRLANNKGFGFPAVGFKAATIGASRFYDKSVTMVALRQAIFFTGEPGDDGQALVPIEGDPIMREDVVRVGRGSADLRYRPQFTEWQATLQVTYVTSMIDRNSLLSLIDAGGMGCGVGDWRPEKNGTFGTYRIDDDSHRKVEVVTVR